LCLRQRQGLRRFLRAAKVRSGTWDKALNFTSQENMAFTII
jgi:hypothetical protein